MNPLLSMAPDEAWRCIREWQATQDSEETTPKLMCRKYGLPSSTLNKRLNHPACPKTHRITGPTGRISAFELTPELEQFLAAPKQPGKKLSGDPTKLKNP